MMADALGVSIPSIIRWEADVAAPNDYNHYKIEQILARGAPATPPSVSDEQSAQHSPSFRTDEPERMPSERMFSERMSERAKEREQA